MLEDTKYRCLCGTHVETGAYILAIIGLVYQVFNLITTSISLFSSFNGISAAVLFFVILQILIHYGIIHAQKKRTPVFYLPYLIYYTIVQVVYGIVIVVGTVMYIFFIDALISSANEVAKQNGRQPVDYVPAWQVVAVVIAVFIFFWLISLYLLGVVWRAYNYLKDEVNYRMNSKVTYAVPPV